MKVTMTKATGNEILFSVVYYKVRSSCISQENQIGYDGGGGGTIIFFAWIKFFSFKKYFLLLSLVVISGSG